MHILVDRLSLFCSSVVRILLVNLFSFIRVPVFLSVRSVHINRLPEECLLSIFDRIPLFDLMRLDRVCHQWAVLLPSATVRRRHTLVLIIIAGGHLEISYNRDRPFGNLPVAQLEASLTLPFLVPRPLDSRSFQHSNLLNLKAFTEAKIITEMARLKRAHLTGQLAAYISGLFPNVSTLEVIHPKCALAELQSVADYLTSSWPFKVKLSFHNELIDIYRSIDDILFSQTNIRVLVANVVMMFAFHVYVHCSSYTQQNLKQSDLKHNILVNVFAYILWIVFRFVCLVYIILQYDYDSQVDGGRKLLKLLKLSSYATAALLVPLVTGLVSYDGTIVEYHLSQSDQKVLFGFVFAFIHLVFVAFCILVEFVFGLLIFA